MQSFDAIEAKRRRQTPVHTHAEDEGVAREPFYGSDLDGLERYLRSIGRAWGRERGGWRFGLRLIGLPLIVCGLCIYLAFSFTPLRNGPLLRIWSGGGLMLLAVVYWTIEARLVRRHWFAVYRSRSSVELRMWTGTFTGLKRHGEIGHIAIRVDRLNHQLRVRSHETRGGKVETRYSASFSTFDALRAAIESEWTKNTFLTIYEED